MLPRIRLALVALGLAACNFTQAGLDPDPTTMNFPIAVELHRDSTTGQADYLFVVQSNFDLRFNSGAIHAVDLAALEDQIAACPVPGEDCVLDQITYVGDTRAGMHPVIADEVGLGSHADGLVLRADGNRMYLPVRSTRDLTTIGFDPVTGTFDCDQDYRDEDVAPGDAPWDAEDIRRCGDARRITRREAVANERELDLVGDPIAVALIPGADLGVDGVGDFLLYVMREGRIALMLDDGTQPTPELVHVADGFPDNLVTITVEPGSGVAWLTSVGSNELARVGIVVDEVTPTRSFVYDAGRLRLGGIDTGEDTRDFRFHPTDPERAFVLSRRPNSVVEVDLSRRGLTPSDFAITDVFEIGDGPSRLVTTTIDGRTFVLASCFDAQRLFVIDADIGALVAVVGGFSGPFEIVIDEDTRRLYMADFSVSVVRVLDLEPLVRGEVPELIATIGDPTPVVSLTGT